MTATHESILKLISYRYGLGYLNKRHRYASNIGRSFDFSQARLRAARAARSRRRSRRSRARWAAAARPKQHDLCELETSGLLDRLGYEIPKVTYDSLFRYPDTVRQAFADRPRLRATTRARKRAPKRGPWFRKDVPPTNPAAGTSALQVSGAFIDGACIDLNTAFRPRLREVFVSFRQRPES